MHRFRHFVRELHRRSVWQVLGVYLVGSWVALQVVDVLTGNYGLPDWVPAFALVLLVIGLPIVLATAVVQEGAPSRQTWKGTDAPGVDPSALLEGEPHPFLLDESREATDTTESDAVSGPDTLGRLFTWRNAVLGGVGAAALLVLAVGAYFFMWSQGIGPVGSLVAQGVIDQREKVVLAEFENSTADEGLGEVVTEAFRVDLVRSPVLSPVGSEFTSQVLARMDRDPEARLDHDLAREVAQREGLKAVVRGEVAAAGSRYVLTTSLIAAQSGETLAAFRETAESPEAIIDAIDRLSQRLREKAGESLRSIKGGEPLHTVTTGSLEALRLYSRAIREQEGGDGRRAVALLEEAVEVDPDFAMAHRKAGAIYRNQGRMEEARESVTRAYELRDRLTDRERYLATAMYHQFVTEDRERTVRAYRNVLDVHPDDGTALNNLGVLYGDEGDLERGAEMYRRAVAGPDESATAHGNLIEVLVELGRLDEALEAVNTFRERYGAENASVRYREQRAAAFGGQWARADSLLGVGLAESDISPGERTFIAIQRAVIDGARGRFREALEHLDDARRLARDVDVAGPSLFEAEVRAFLEGLRAGDDEAVSTLHRGLSSDLRAARDSIPQGLLRQAELYASWGRPDSARALLDRLPEGEDGEPGAADRLRLVRAAVALAEGRPEEALRLAREVREADGCPGGSCGLLLIAEAQESAQRPDSAAVAYEEWLATRDWDRFVEYSLLQGPVLENLCRLHDDLGDPERAEGYCHRFAELWSGGDPSVRPRVRVALERMEGGATEGAGS